MASGSIQLTSPQPWAGEILWESTVFPEAQKSSVTAACYVWRTDGGESYGNNPYWGRLFVGDTAVEIAFNRINGERQLVGTCQTDIPHESDGTAFVTIKAEILGSDNNDLTGSTLSGSGEAELDRIPQGGGETAKPSVLSLSADSLKMGETQTITITPSDPRCRHDLTYTFGAASGEIARNAETEVSWQVPDLASFCGLYDICTVTCRTFLGDQDLGLTSEQFTLSVPDGPAAEVSEAVLGEPCRVVTARKSANFRVSVRLLLGGQEYTVGEGPEDSFSWTPEYGLGKLQPEQQTLTGTLLCVTYNKESLVSRIRTPVSIRVPQNEETCPEILSLTLTPETGDLDPRLGYLRGKTGLRADFSARSQCSEIRHFEIRAGRMKAAGNPAVLSVLPDSGTVWVTAEVRDARGYSASLVRSIQVEDYEKPRVVPAEGRDRIHCLRSEKTGVISETGTCLLIRAAFRITDILRDGENLNKGTLHWRLRQGAGEFSPWRELFPGETIITNVLPSLKDSYLVQLKAADSLGESNPLDLSILPRAISFVLYDGVDGAAFGKYPELPHVVDVAEHMTLLVRGRLELPGEKWQDLGMAPGVLAPAPAHGAVEGAKFRVSGGNHVFMAFSCRMTEGAVNEEPLPGSFRPKQEISAICPSEEGAVTVCLGTDGFLRIRPLLGKQDPCWIDGALDYFI